MKLKYIATAAICTTALASCSDEFLQEKKNYEQTSVEAYNHYSGALGRLSDCYVLAMPDCGGSAGWKYTSTGSADMFSQSTEEYAGFGTFVDPQANDGKGLSAITGSTVPDFFQGSMGNIRENAWGRIRNINDCIRGVRESSLPQEQKDEILGQCYFLRAWCYYLMVRWYGGVPIITEVQNPEATSITPRSTTKECVDFICEDLDESAKLLEPFTTKGGWEAKDYGRVTSGTALALKGKMLLLWASPVFNRANDQQRWKDAYEVIKASIPVLNSCGNNLAYDGNPGNCAANWAKMFIEDANPEAVFVTLYNTTPSGGVPDYARGNPWEHGIRPSNAMGGGGKVPASNMVDLFPMSDGKRPSSYNSYTTLAASDIVYDSEHPFMNRDPRFYRTFAFPGVRWYFNGNPMSSENNNPYNGSEYAVWSYVWYLSDTDRNNIEPGKTYGPDNLLANAKGFYVRKRTDDKELNGTSRYVFTTNNGFKQSAAPYMEIRYTEVLLNLAEAACMSGDMTTAVEQLQKIRARVGYTAENNYGLDASISSNQAACMAAVLYERQIELAYEGKRYDDLRRWMLFDGGVNVPAGAPASWKLTGFGGNTCTWLGFAPLNGTRRETIEFRIQNKEEYGFGLGKEKYEVGKDANGNTYAINPDPLYAILGGEQSADGAKKYFDTRKAYVVNLNQATNNLNTSLDKLKDFYVKYLERNNRKGDSYNSSHHELYIQYQPNYYILGFNRNAMDNNVTLPQNIGWEDANNGGANGTFDPLAE